MEGGVKLHLSLILNIIKKLFLKFIE
jgi:hypothetical protein